MLFITLCASMTIGRFIGIIRICNKRGNAIHIPLPDLAPSTRGDVANKGIFIFSYGPGKPLKRRYQGPVSTIIPVRDIGMRELESTQRPEFLRGLA